MKNMSGMPTGGAKPAMVPAGGKPDPTGGKNGTAPTGSPGNGKAIKGFTTGGEKPCKVAG